MAIYNAFQASGSGSSVVAKTAKEAAIAYFDKNPKSRKCNVSEGFDDGRFFTVTYGSVSKGEWPRYFKGVTKKQAYDLEA